MPEANFGGCLTSTRIGFSTKSSCSPTPPPPRPFPPTQKIQTTIREWRGHKYTQDRLISNVFQGQTDALGKTICLPILTEEGGGGGGGYFFKTVKSDKKNLRITSKSHTHLQTLTKTPPKFQKIRVKLKEKLRSQEWTHFMTHSQTERWTHRVKQYVSQP